MVTLEAEDLQLVVVVEIDVELAAVAKETAAVEIVPDGLEEMDVTHLVAVILDYGLEVAVESEERHGIEVGEGVGDDRRSFRGGEGVLVEDILVTLFIFIEGDEESGSVDEECGTADGFAQHLHGLESVAEVGGDGDAAL
jgi:hypothetical protein